MKKLITNNLYLFILNIYLYIYITLLLTIFDSFYRNQVFKVTYTIHITQLDTKHKLMEHKIFKKALVLDIKLHNTALNMFFQYCTI